MPAPLHAASATGPAGTIHDIGYRRYEGSRLGRGYAVRTLYAQSLKACYGIGRSGKSKILPFVLLGLLVAPAVAIVAVVGFTNQHDLPLGYDRYPIVMQALIDIFVAAQAPQLISRDLRFRTVNLYFARPLSRTDYALARLAGLVSALFVLIALPLAVLYVGGLLAKLPAGHETVRFLAGLATAAILSLVLAGVSGVIAAYTTRRGFGVAAIIAVLFVSFGAVNGVAGGLVTADAANKTLAGYVGLFSPFSLVDGVQHWVLRAQSSFVEPPPGDLGGAVFVVATAVLIAACWWALQRRYRKVAVA